MAAMFHMPERGFMLRIPSCSRLCALLLFFVALPLSNAFAHCFVGARFLPATLAIDDPCVADELSLPTVAWSQTGDVPPATEWDISAELSKRITEDLGISIGDTWSNIHQPGGFTQSGFSDLETTLQYQLLSVVFSSLLPNAESPRANLLRGAFRMFVGEACWQQQTDSDRNDVAIRDRPGPIPINTKNRASGSS